MLCKCNRYEENLSRHYVEERQRHGLNYKMMAERMLCQANIEFSFFSPDSHEKICDTRVYKACIENHITSLVLIDNQKSQEDNFAELLSYFSFQRHTPKEDLVIIPNFETISSLTCGELA